MPRVQLVNGRGGVRKGEGRTEEAIKGWRCRRSSGQRKMCQSRIETVTIRVSKMRTQREVSREI